MDCALLAVEWLSRTLLVWGSLAVLLLLLVVGFVVAMRRGWIDAAKLTRNPFAKYVVLSVVAHLALAVWLYSSQLLETPDFGSQGNREPIVVELILEDFGLDEATTTPMVQDPLAEPTKPKAQLAANVPNHTQEPNTRTAARVAPDLTADAIQQQDRIVSPPVEQFATDPSETPAYDEQDRFSHNPFATDAAPEIPSQRSKFADNETSPEPARFPSQVQPAAMEPQLEPQLEPRLEPTSVAQTPADQNREVPLADEFSETRDQHLAEPDELPASINPIDEFRPRLDEPSITAQALSTSRDATLNPQIVQTTESVKRTLRAQPELRKDVVQTQSLPTRRVSSMRNSQRRLLPQNTVTGRRDGRSTGQTTGQINGRIDGQPVSAIYRDRWAQDRLAVARARGGDENTEAAVQNALRWLAAAQGSDGRWDASHYGSGRAVVGHDRRSAGITADTGVTGLSLLAFLGSGHTHLSGEYQRTLADGIEFLLRSQDPNDGSLAGNARSFAAMYCHGMATLALSEALALTGEPELEQPVQRAIAYTLAAQSKRTGGWRYRPLDMRDREAGDTSQLGWQLMSLTSAHYGGMPIPSESWGLADQFLDSVAWGSHGGLASYRPGERPSAPMTAEALLCRLFLRTPTTDPLVSEAASYLMRELPGNGRVNYYYWYYGTLALYHLQDEHWARWNSAVKRQLVGRQRKTGVLAGSWDADSVWGGSGGRVYTTAIAALTLEVYYRYRPLTESRSAEQTARRP